MIIGVKLSSSQKSRDGFGRGCSLLGRGGGRGALLVLTHKQKNTHIPTSLVTFLLVRLSSSPGGSRIASSLARGIDTRM